MSIFRKKKKPQPQQQEMMVVTFLSDDGIKSEETFPLTREMTVFNSVSGWNISYENVIISDLEFTGTIQVAIQTDFGYLDIPESVSFTSKMNNLHLVFDKLKITVLGGRPEWDYCNLTVTHDALRPSTLEDATDLLSKIPQILADL